MGMIVREARGKDRGEIHEALVACDAFTDEEVRVALEVLDLGLLGGIDGEYPVFAAEVEKHVRGYACVGRTPLTACTWHLYWICVHPAAQRNGVGRALREHSETFVSSRGGRRIVLETSGRPTYRPAHNFYEAAGYIMVGRIPDFYKPGDDCLMYCKTLKASAWSQPIRSTT